MHDRYLNVDDPRPDPGAPAQTTRPAAGIKESTPAAETPHAPTESETDRCIRTTREVLLGHPGPHSLEAAAAEIERRLREVAEG